MTEWIEPPWLTARVDQRVAMAAEVTRGATETGHPPRVVLINLTDPPPHIGQPSYAHAVWERTCDRCGRYCPYPDAFHIGSAGRTLASGIKVGVTFGLCGGCRAGIAVK